MNTDFKEALLGSLFGKYETKVTLIGENHDMYHDLGITRLDEINLMIKENMLDSPEGYYYENNLKSDIQNEDGYYLNASDSIQHARVQLSSVGMALEKMIALKDPKLTATTSSFLNEMHTIVMSVNSGFFARIGQAYHLMQADEDRIKGNSDEIITRIDNCFKEVNPLNYEISMLNVLDSLVKLDSVLTGHPLEKNFEEVLAEANYIREEKMAQAVNKLVSNEAKSVVKLGQNHIASIQEKFKLDPSIKIINHEEWQRKLLPDSFKRNAKQRQKIKSPIKHRKI